MKREHDSYLCKKNIFMKIMFNKAGESDEESQLYGSSFGLTARRLSGFRSFCVGGGAFVFAIFGLPHPSGYDSGDETIGFLHSAYAQGLSQPAGSSAGKPYGVIEIGSKGVRGYVFDLERAETAPNCSQDEDLYLKCLNTKVLDQLNVNPIAAESLGDTVKAALEIKNTLTGRYGVLPDRIVAVASSGLRGVDHKDRLAIAVRDAIGSDLPFVNAQEEARFAFDGILGMIPAKSRAERERQAVVIDIGSGNTKGAYLDASGGQKNLVSFGWDLGTKTATDAIDRRRGDDPFSAAAEDWRTTVLRPLVRSELDRKPGVGNRERVYLVGGIVWALSNLTQPESKLKFPPITPEHISSLESRSARSDASSNLCSSNPDSQNNRDIEKICNTFSVNNLSAGGKILRTLSDEMNFKSKKVFFIRDSIYAWPLGYLRSKVAAGANVAALNMGGAGNTAPPVATGGVLRLHGSNTIGAELAPRMLSAWVSKNGGEVDVWRGEQEERTTLVRGDQRSLPASIELRSHGSGTAASSLLSGAADVGNMSRRMNDAEAVSLQSFGDMRGHKAEAVVALDGVAVIVHPNNRIESLTPAQVAAIYSGQIRDWSEVGGAPGPITLFSRDTKSGTFDTFKALVMGSAKMAPAVMLEASEVLSDRVSSTPGAIGFVGVAYLRNAKPVNVNECGQRYAPTSFSIKTEEYPLFRRLYMYRRPGDRNPFVEPFIRFALSDDGQPVVEASGFVNQLFEIGGPEFGELRRGAPVSSTASATEQASVQRMKDLSYGLSRLSATIRFEKGKADFDSRAIEDLGRLVAYMRKRENGSRALHVIGFASEPGPNALNFRLSIERAKNVTDFLKNQQVRVANSFGVGENLFVACNEPEERGFMNQRVEIWLSK